MPILFGALASLFIGISDTFGRVSSRRADSISHVSTQMLTGVFITLPVALVLGHEFVGASVLSGAVSGVSIAFGLAIVYRGMALSSAAIVAPTAAVVAALLPLAWDLIGGTSLTTFEIVGCIVAISSLALTTFNPDLGDRVRTGLILALVGGVFFGLAVVFAADTSEASGAWPAVSQRAVGFVAMAALATRRRIPVLLEAPVRRFGLLGGVSGAIGMLFWVLGGQQGDVGTVSVVASTYPATVAVLAARFDEDQLRWWQAVGIAGAIAGSACIALG